MRKTFFSSFTTRISNMSIPKTHHVSLFKETSPSVDAIIYTEIDAPQITGPHDVIVKNKYAGVNFIEGYFRKGTYDVPTPYVFGREAAGVVAAVGDKVQKYQVGDKIAYLSPGSFAQYTKLPESHVQASKLSAETTDEQLKLYAATLLQGLTALTFVHEAYEVKKGDYILVWAAAGGVGQSITRYTSALGAHVIAVASTEEKLKIAKDLGAEFLVNSLTEDVLARVKEITNGVGVAASFDSVGKDTWDITYNAVARKGTIVSFGNASGVVPPVALFTLTPRNLRLLRPLLMGYLQTAEEWDHYSKLLQDSLKAGLVSDSVFKTYPLSEYKQAATDLEGRKTTGKLVLEIPQ